MYEAFTELSSEGNMQSVMDLAKHPNGERRNRVDTEEDPPWPKL